jgi:hypothetical protein
MEHKIRTFALSTALALIFMCSANAASLMGNVNQKDKQQEVTVSQLDFTEMYDNQDDDHDYEDDC